jgi:hypothetical protein
MKFSRLALSLTLTLLLAVTPATAQKSTPTPGGANAVAGVSGKVGQTLFNGVVRLTIVELRDATPEEAGPLLLNAGQKGIVMTAIIRNGTQRNFIDLVRYTLADKDDVSVVVPDYRVTPNPPNIQQAAALRQKALFPVDKDFVPTKVIVSCATCGSTKFTAFRVDL